MLSSGAVPQTVLEELVTALLFAVFVRGASVDVAVAVLAVPGVRRHHGCGQCRP